jgi:membrane-associated phospholipid phosphatase
MTRAHQCFASLGLLVALTALMYSGAVERIDLWVLLECGKLQNPTSTMFWRYATKLGSPTAVVVSGILIVVVLLMQKRHVVAKRITIVLLAAIALDVPFKNLVHRPRPLETIAGTMPSSFSFPSGHVLFATAIYFGIAYALLDSGLVVRKGLVWAIACSLVLLVALSRLCLGVHYPTDILGGFLTGLFCVCFANVMYPKIANPPGNQA